MYQLAKLKMFSLDNQNFIEFIFVGNIINMDDF